VSPQVLTLCAMFVYAVSNAQALRVPFLHDACQLQGTVVITTEVRFYLAALLILLIASPGSIMSIC